MIFKDADRGEIIKEEKLSLQLRCGNRSQRLLVTNFASETSESHFGSISVNAKIETEERTKLDPKKDKFELQTMKFQIQCSSKKTKKFNLSLPIHRGVKRSTDSKLHFLLELTSTGGLVTVLDDYSEAGMKIKTKVPEVSITEALELQKKRQDKRRKDSMDGQAPVEDHNDPDFKAGSEQDEN